MLIVAWSIAMVLLAREHKKREALHGKAPRSLETAPHSAARATSA